MQRLDDYLRRKSSKNLRDRKSTRLNSSHTVIYTLSLHDALPISSPAAQRTLASALVSLSAFYATSGRLPQAQVFEESARSEEHTSELQSHRDLHSFPTRRSSDLLPCSAAHSSVRSRVPLRILCNVWTTTSGASLRRIC